MLSDSEDHETEKSFQAVGEMTYHLPPDVIFCPPAAITFQMKQRSFMRNMKSSLIMRVLCHGKRGCVV